MPASSTTAEGALTTAAVEARHPLVLRAVGVLLLGVVLTALLVARRPTSLTDPTIWAEDGYTFGAGAFNGAGPLTPYAGQLWPIERVAAWLVTQAPVRLWPVLFYVLGCVLVAFPMTVLLQQRAREIFGGLGWRVLGVFLLVALPAVYEVQGSITNIHWWWFAVLWVLLALPRPVTVAGRICELVTVGLLAVTATLGIFALPVVLWRLLSDRSWYSWLRGAVVALAAVVSVVVAATAGRGGAGMDLTPVPELVVRRWGALVIGEDFGSGTGREFLLWAGIAVALAIGVLVLLDLRGPSWAWVLGGLGVAVSGLALAVAEAGLEALQWPFSADRYAVPLILASMLVVIRALGAKGPAPRIVAAVVLACCMLGIIGDARLRPAGEEIPAAELQEFANCIAQRRAAADEAGPTCTLKISPPGWELKVE